MSMWKDKTVVITGGSAGLGFAIAHEFAQRGAKPILLGRSPDKLQAATDKLRSAGHGGESCIADVLHADQVRRAVDEIISRHGKIDVWVNNVGRSTRVELALATPEQFRELMEVNFISAVQCTRIVLPFLEKSSGHLVNIGSLSSRTAWPFLGPYTTSKFALAGYTQQLRIEGPSNVHFLLALPGPIQREDAGLRYHGGEGQLPGHALQPGAGARLHGLSVTKVARRIVDACQKRRAEIVMPRRVRLLFLIAAISPKLADWILRRLKH